MVISQFYPIIGGAEKQAQLLAKKLIGKGIGVNILTGWWNIRTPRKEMIEGIKVFRNFSFWGMFGIKGIRTLGVMTYMVSLAIYLLFHKREYDIIHVHQVLYPAFVTVLLGKEVLQKPVLVKNACSGITSDINQLKKFPFGSIQMKYLLKKIDYLVAVSEEGIKEFKAIGFPESRIIYIPNGALIPLENKTQYYNEVLRVIIIARLDWQKGIDVLLKAWAKVMQQEKKLKLLIVGDGPFKSELKRLSKSLGLIGSVEFTGLVHNVEKYFRDADIFVLPSRAEGLPNALLEAMSYGISCITTKVGGNVEVLGANEDEKISKGEFMVASNGVLVNPEDVEGLYEAMLFLIRNEKVREDMGSRARVFIQENYSIDLIADRYIGLYHQILEGKF